MRDPAVPRPIDHAWGDRSWPGLEEIVDPAREALERGVGVFLAGAAGSGRTWLIQRVLSGIDPATRNKVWTGGDLHRLDSEQARKLAKAIEVGRVLPLATCLPGHPLASDLERQCRDRVVLRMPVPPPSPARMLAAVESELGGPLDARSSPAFVPRRSGGDLVLLTEAVRSARRGGALVDRDGTWHLVDAVPRSEGLRRFLFARVGFQEEDEVAAQIMDVLGLAPGLGVGTLTEILGASPTEEALERLEAAGHIVVSDLIDGGSLRIAEPVAEIVLPTTIGHLRRMRLCTRIVDALGTRDFDTLRPRELLALARHAIPEGRYVDPRALLRAASEASRAARPDLALQLADAAERHGGGFDARLMVAAVEAQLGWTDHSLDHLVGLHAEAEGDPRRESMLEAFTTIVRGRIGDEAYGWHLPERPSSELTTPDLGALLRLDQPAASPEAEGHDDPEQLHALLEGDRMAQAASMSALSGDVRLSHEQFDRGEMLLRSVGADTTPILARRALVDGFDGQMAESIALVTGLLDAAGSDGRPEQAATVAWILGDLLLYSGRAHEAARQLTTAQALAERAGMERIAMIIRPGRAVALAQSGTLDEAVEVLQPALGSPLDGFANAETAVQGFAWIHACSGRTTEALDAFVRAAEIQESRQRPALAAYAWTEVARAGGARLAARRLRAIAGGIQSRGTQLMIQQAYALAEYEELSEQPWSATDGTVRLADDFTRLGGLLVTAGVHLNAAEALSCAAELLERADRPRDSAALNRRALEQLAVCGVTDSPFLRRKGGAVLSQREAEIARGAARGQSNREIAETLVLSVRTVETHLQRVYRKLGVRRRAELADALPRVQGTSGFVVEEFAID